MKLLLFLTNGVKTTSNLFIYLACVVLFDCFFRFVYVIILLLPDITALFSSLLALPETTTLPSQGKGKVCVQTILLRPHLWEYAGYVVVVLKSNTK